MPVGAAVAAGSDAVGVSIAPGVGVEVGGAAVSVAVGVVVGVVVGAGVEGAGAGVVIPKLGGAPGAVDCVGPTDTQAASIDVRAVVIRSDRATTRTPSWGRWPNPIP